MKVFSMRFFLPRYLLNLVKFEKINFLLFVFAIVTITCNLLLGIIHNSSSTSEKSSTDKAASSSITSGKDQVFFQAESHPKFIDFKHHYTVQNGDTFIKILTNIGIPPSEAHFILKTFNKVYDVSSLSIGQNINLLISAKDGSKVIVGDKPHSITIYIDNKIINGMYDDKKGNYNLNLLKQSVNNKSKLVQGFVKDSLYNSIIKTDTPPSIIMDYMKLLSHEINFKRDIKNNSEFKILFDYTENSHTKQINGGNILYASLSLNGKQFEIYQYKDKNGNIKYFHSDGKNLKKALLQKPIKQARISSKFGIRMHPITRCKKMHKGVDYASRKGTPVLSAGDGIVQLVKYSSSYGKYIVIKHNNEYTTLYAHMSKFHPQINKGSRIKQGQVIGYVGNSGRTTGVHLHHEVRRHGIPINPVKANTYASNSLEGQNLIAFKSQKKKIDQVLHKESGIMLAKNHTSKHNKK